MGLHTHLQQVITSPLILLRPLLTPDPMIWCFKMLSLLSIRRKVPETPSQEYNPPGLPSNSCNPEFKCFSAKLRSGQIPVQSCQSGVPLHFWSILPNHFIFMVTTCLGRDSGRMEFIMMHSTLWVRDSSLFNWNATNVTNGGLGELDLVALFSLLLCGNRGWGSQQMMFWEHTSVKLYLSNQSHNNGQ